MSPRTYPPAPGWSSDGHRIKAALEYSRGPEKVWVYGALRVRDGKALTLSAPSGNTKEYLRLLEAVAHSNPTGELYLITDNLWSHNSTSIREWLENHPRVEQVFTPVGACWLKACRRGGGEYIEEKPWQDGPLLMVKRSSGQRG